MFHPLVKRGGFPVPPLGSAPTPSPSQVSPLTVKVTSRSPAPTLGTTARHTYLPASSCRTALRVSVFSLLSTWKKGPMRAGMSRAGAETPGSVPSSPVSSWYLLRLFPDHLCHASHTENGGSEILPLHTRGWGRLAQPHGSVLEALSCPHKATDQGQL